MITEENLFEAAAALPDAERAAYLNSVCAGQPELRARVEALLRSHEVSGFMEAGTRDGGLPPPLRPNDGGAFIDHRRADSPVEQCGQRMGHYKLLEQIGEGGFGVVWVAEQSEPVRRRVALKIIKPGMDSREVIARFGQERQALAMMDHPNIAKVFDAGATDHGRPYFVMELVRGVKMTEYCDEANLPLTERLKLFIAVCQAVQHAHQKGIIHRDLKPSNILVSPGDDGTPAPKVIDFGVAKAVQQPLTDDTVYTQFEQMIGTPAYMSPEQAGLGPMDIDTRSDVYSLGVLLYELLTGRPPFDPKELLSAGPDEMRRVIREVEPPKPSTRRTQLLNAVGSGKHPAKAQPGGANRNEVEIAEGKQPADGSPKGIGGSREQIFPLKSSIAPDLDWIVMKALEKDRARRYETANGLAADIQRFLNNEPVSAGPPSAAYRIRKFVRRNRRPVAAALLIVTTLLAGIVGTSLGLFRARTERDTAQMRLYESLLGESRATLLARIDGYRPMAFSLLRKAHQLGISGKDPDEIRQQAVDCLGDFIGLPPVSIDDVPSRVSAIALHPQRSLIAVGMRNGSIQLRDIESGRESTVLEGHRASVMGLAFDADGILTSVDTVGMVMSWSDAGADKWTSRQLQEVEDSVYLADISMPSHRMATVHPQGVALWENSGAGLITRLSGLTQPVALNPTGELLAAVEAKGLMVYGIETRKILHTATSGFGVIVSAAFNADDSLMAYGCDEGLMVLEMPSFRQRMSVRSDSQSSLAFHPRRPLLASGSISGQVRLWNVVTNREEAVMNFAGGTGSVSHLVFRRDGRYLAAAKDNHIRVWNISGTAERLLLAGHSGGVPCSEFSPDGKRLATGGKDRTVRIWDTATGEPVQVISDFTAYVQSIALHPSGRFLATGDYAGRVLVWDWEANRIVAEASGPAGQLSPPLGRDIYKVAFSPDGRYLAASGDGIHLWRLPGETPSARDATDGRLTLESAADVDGNRSLTLCFSSDSSLIAWIDNNSHIRLWDVSAAKSLPYSGPDVLRGWLSLAFIPGCRLLAYVSDRQQLQVWNAAADAGEFTLGEAGDFRGWHLSVSPDGKWLLGESDGTTPVLWNLVTRRRLLSLPRTHSPVWTMSWSPHSESFAVGLSDGSTSIWSLGRIRAALATLDLDWTEEELRTPAAPLPGHPKGPNPTTPVDSLLASGSDGGRGGGGFGVLAEELALRRTEDGPRHPDTIKAMSRLATSLSRAGRRDEALRLREEVLSLSRDVNGPKHKHTIHAIGGLAISYYVAGRWDDAIALREEQLELSREVIGPEHPDTLSAMNSLAPMYPLVGRLNDAFSMSEKVLDLRRRVSGPEHPDTLDSLNNLTTVYSDLGRHEEAIRLGEELLNLRLNVNGPDHADTFKAKINLAASNQDIGRRHEALKLGDEAMAMTRRINGPEHPDTLSAMGLLSVFYGSAGRGDEAIALRKDRLTLSRRINGAKHPDTLEAMQSLASGYEATGDADNALKLREETLTLRREVHGPDRPQTLAAMTNLAISYRKAGNLDAAIPLQEESLRLKRDRLRPGHPWMIVALNNLAECYVLKGRETEANELRKEVDQLKRNVPAPGRKTTAESQPPAEGAAAPQAAGSSSNEGAAPVPLIPAIAEWKWLHPLDGQDPEKSIPGFHKSFPRQDFDDSKWNTGKDSDDPNGGFGYGLGFAGVNIGRPEMKDRHSAYFRHRFTTMKPHSNLELRCRRDDGIIVYLDGKEVVRDNMEPGDDAYLLHSAAAMGKEDEGVVHRYPIPGELAPGPHVLAISVHNTAQPGSDLRLGGVTLATAK